MHQPQPGLLRRALTVTLIPLGITIAAAFGATPSFAAGPQPALSDNNSAWCCARVAGQYFTPNDWARVDIYENGQLVNGQFANGSLIDDRMVATSAETFFYCPNGWLHLCSLGGTFAYEYDPHDQCFNRYAIAMDVRTGVRTKPVLLSCS